MADIKVVIQLQDTVEDIIEKLGSSTEVNNASIQTTDTTFKNVSTKNNGTNMKSWANGALSLADGYLGGADTQLIEQYGYNGYVFGAVPDSKQLTVTLEVRGQYIDSIIIYGDKNANQFPTKAYRDGNPNDIIYSDDATWAIKFDSATSSHTITFLEWNRANYNACITYVAELKNKLYLDRSWIKSIESLSQSTGQPREIYYGVVPNSGSIEILDVDGEIYDYINDGVIENSNLPIQISVNDNVCQSHISNDSNYSRDKIFSIQISDILQSWGTFKISPKVTKNEKSSLNTYFQKMMEEFGFSYIYIKNMLGSYALNPRIVRDGKNAEEIMELISIPYQYHKCETLLEFINSICEICQFCVMCDSLNQPIFVDGNSSFNNNSIVKITPNVSFNIPERDLLIKNKVYNVKYLENTFEKNIKDICNKTFYLRDSSGDIDLDNIKSIFGEAKIVNNRILGIFIECSDVTSEFIWDTSLEEDEISHPYKVILEGQNYLETSATTGFFLDLYSTKDDYDFTSHGIAELTKYRTLNSKLFAVSIDLGENLSKLNSIDKISISIMQQCISKNSNEKLLNSISENVYEMRDSMFLSTQTIYNSEENIYTHNGSQILNNYGNGISVANITIGCLDLYDIDGNKVKDFSKGEIIQVGDIVRVDKDNNGNSLWSYKDGSPMFWKVTGRNFRKVGVPMIDLELQEVRVVG